MHSIRPAGFRYLVPIGLIVGVGFLQAQPPLIVNEGPADPPATKTDASLKPRFDSQGDPLPPGAVARLGSLRLRHGDLVNDVLFAENDKVLLSAGDDHSIRLWDTATGKELRRFTSSEAERSNVYHWSRWVSCVLMSPDGKRVVACERQGGLRMCDFATGKLLSNPNYGGISSAAFSPDGRLLATAIQGTSVVVFDAVSLEVRSQYRWANVSMRTIAWNPDGKTLAGIGDDPIIRIWDAASGKISAELAGHESKVASIAYSPDGKTLASGGVDKTIRLWDLTTHKERALLGRHDKGVRRVAFSPDGKTLASGSEDRTIKLWDVAAEKILHVLEGHQGTVNSVRFSSDGKTLASAGNDSKVGLWDVASGKERLPQPGPQINALKFGFREDGQLVALGRDGTIRWWDWKRDKERQTTTGSREDSWHAAAFSPRRDVLAIAYMERSVRLVDTATGDGLGLLDHGNRVRVVAFSQDGKELASSDGKAVLVWDLATRKVVRRLEPGDVELMAFAPDGKLFIGGLKASLIDDRQTGKVRPLPISFGQMLNATFLPDGRTIACGDHGGNVQLWDVETGKRTGVLSGLHGYVCSVALSPDQRLLFAGGWRRMAIWEIETGIERQSFQGFEGDSLAAAFSPDGRILASGNGGQQLLVWDIPGPLPSLDPKATEIIATLWNDLGSADGGVVHRAIWGLAARPSAAVAHLKTTLKAVPALDRERLTRLLSDLDGEDFAPREKAMAEILRIGDMAQPVLQKFLSGTPSLEAQRRVERILRIWAVERTSPGRMQGLRALEALEHIGTAEARELLDAMSRGAAEARFTRDASSSLERLKKRTS